MRDRKWTRREVSKTSTAVAAGVLFADPNGRAAAECRARLFQSFFCGAEGQQLPVDNYAHRSFHAQIKEKPGHRPRSALKWLNSDPAAVLVQSEEIRRALRQTFQGVIDRNG